MADINQLKYQARREEQRNNWSRAIELYSRALEKSEETLEIAPDVSLYNRIGDLHLRQNDTDEAIAFYLKAVDRYAEQGLHPGAIALCNKILRVSPSRVDVHRKLGRLHVATGLLAEARASFREYATRMEERGEEEKRLEALFELAALTEDGEMYLDLVEELVDQDREEDAAEKLRELIEMRTERGEDVSDLRNRVLELDPSAEGAEVEPSPGETGAAVSGAEEGGTPSPEPEDEEAGAAAAMDFGGIDLEEPSEPAGVEPGQEAPEEAATPGEAEPEGAEPAPAGPTGEAQGDAEQEVHELLEELDVEAAAAEGGGGVDGAVAPDEAGQDAEVSLRYAQVLQKNGQTDAAIEQLEETLRNLLQRDAPREALPVAERLIELDPGNPRAQEAIAAVPTDREAEEASAPGASEAESGEADGGPGADDDVVPFSVSEEVAPPEEVAESEEASADLEETEDTEEELPDFTGMLQNMGWLSGEEGESEEDEEEEKGDSSSA